jgi:hypothetical protein
MCLQLGQNSKGTRVKALTNNFLHDDETPHQEGLHR